MRIDTNLRRSGSRNDNSIVFSSGGSNSKGVEINNLKSIQTRVRASTRRIEYNNNNNNNNCNMAL